MMPMKNLKTKKTKSNQKIKTKIRKKNKKWPLQMKEILSKQI